MGALALFLCLMASTFLLNCMKLLIMNSVWNFYYFGSILGMVRMDVIIYTYDIFVTRIEWYRNICFFF